MFLLSLQELVLETISEKSKKIEERSRRRRRRRRESTWVRVFEYRGREKETTETERIRKRGMEMRKCGFGWDFEILWYVAILVLKAHSLIFFYFFFPLVLPRCRSKQGFLMIWIVRALGGPPWSITYWKFPFHMSPQIYSYLEPTYIHSHKVYREME